ncbi:30S ribosome-binding factor RbfA [Isachenkonia alkalipeptolytica]|uniref:Ribosome-binding factor A n=1 Tax=Isachenkonia alkalipeptolytica TaxID=2565777 RepID=A0AA44BD79_9CLOT|nr:30S ribosome-binding factor RbfA [Isachenkonia alkalipeptolytica]NBG87613.1 30S ribosome-binding factor RbfA [Isachenkonia alkalipeptolytica]
MAYSREQRLSEEIKKITSKVIRDELRDPRIAPITSVTEVDVTGDLRYATLFISVLGTEEEKKGTIEALNHAKGLLRKEVGKRISSHFTPEILIKMDESIEQGVKMHQKINEVREKEEARNTENPSEEASPGEPHDQ